MSFVHTVFFWLKKDADQGAAGRIVADCREVLAKVPGVKQLWAGLPTGVGRPVVDNSYQVGLTVVFADAAGHDVYQEHALHKQFIAKHGQNWERVQVYDYVE